MVPSMGFLDKLLGRSKEAAGDVAEKAAPTVDKAQDAAGQAWDKTKDLADDAKDKVGDLRDEGEDTAGDVADEAKDAVSEADAPASGTGPSAA